MSKITEKLLFAAHRGEVSGRPRALTCMEGRCLPLACSHASCLSLSQTVPASSDGFHALWEGSADVERFFEHLGLDRGIGPMPKGTRPCGLYVYEVEYDPDALDPAADFDSDETWKHLRGGRVRRPHPGELDAFHEGLAPWGGISL